MRPTWVVRKRAFTAEKRKTRRLWLSRRRKTAEELGGFDCGDLPMCLRTVCARLSSNASPPERSFTRTGSRPTTASRQRATHIRSPF
jgi:hypothetical protein